MTSDLFILNIYFTTVQRVAFCNLKFYLTAQSVHVMHFKQWTVQSYRLSYILHITTCIIDANVNT